MKRLGLLLLIGAVLVVFGTAGMCDSGPSTPSAQEAATDIAESREDTYEPMNFLDYSNWNLWAEMSDDPATILWCTFYPPWGQDPITIPISGGLTSSEITPFPTRFVYDQGGSGGQGLHVGEKADPFAMYGVRAEFLYGFDPTRTIFTMFKDLAAFCTTEPMLYQLSQTRIVVASSPELVAISQQAEQYLEAGENEKAADALREAETAGE